MKIRTGYVSNSSSSSFLIVGVSDPKSINQIIKSTKLKRKEIVEDMSFGVCEIDGILFLGNEDIYYAGTDLTEEIMNDKTLMQLKKEFAQDLKERYKLTIPIDKIGLHYGEVST